MRSARMLRWTSFALPGAVLLQITACLGPDPEFLVVNLAASTLVAELISLFFRLLTGGLGVPTAMLGA